jgi:hypothetical protein
MMIFARHHYAREQETNRKDQSMEGNVGWEPGRVGGIRSSVTLMISEIGSVGCWTVNSRGPNR